MFTSFTLFCTISSLIALVSTRSVITPNVCKLEPESGPCDALNVRYYFNDRTGSCDPFNYGGCQGNGNNFMTPEECRSTCSPDFQPLKRSSREVSEPQPQTQPSNETTPQLKSPNEPENAVNTTTTKPEPEPEPEPEPVVTTLNPIKVETEAPVPPKKREDVCFQPFADGSCKEHLIRYYYEPEENKCTKFIFKGCFQYDNNFETLEECESLCVLPSTKPPAPSR